MGVLFRQWIGVSFGLLKSVVVSFITKALDDYSMHYEWDMVFHTYGYNFAL